jgi:DNA-binding transcriptional MocR family regulator
LFQYNLVVMLEQTYIRGSSAVKIAESIEAAVSSGRAEPGSPLPPIRELASTLGLSAATVSAAYQTLRQRGIISTDGRRGTRIRHAPPLASRIAVESDASLIDLADGNPDGRLLPSLDKALRRLDGKPRLYGDMPSDPQLLELGRAQFAADGIDARHLTVVSGALDGIERVLREHLRPGDRVAVEDPCFTGIADLLSSLALVAVPFAVDDEGPLPRELDAALSARVKALIVTPRAHNPTGAALTKTRARLLRPIVRKHPELVIIEDDHAGVVAGAAYCTLIDEGRQRWATVRSVSKTLGPDLRVALLCGDAMTVARVEGRQTLGMRWVSHLLQQLVVELLQSREVAKLVDRAAAEYSARRQALLDALSERGIEAHGVSGLNVWIPVPEEAAVIAALAAAGWGVAPGERFRLRSGAAIRVTTARLSPADAVRFAVTLERILQRGSLSRV